jgi:hypothetical protein
MMAEFKIESIHTRINDMSVRIIILSFILAVAMGSASSAQFDFPKNFLPVGISYARSDGKNLFGAEASFVTFTNSLGYGLYTDAQFGSSRWKISAGPEAILAGGDLGKVPVLAGIDGGFVHYKDGNVSRNGFCVRPFIVIYIFIPYFRYNVFRGGEHHSEIGCLAKFPFPIQ